MPVHQQHRPHRRRHQTLKGLDPATTLFIVSSKTFGTLETLTNARLCKAWLLDGLSGEDESGAPSRSTSSRCPPRSTRSRTFGIDPANAFGFWDWVGGRYSVGSAIGTSLVVAIGPERFAEFLAGLHAMDEHFRTTEPSRNVPVLMGLLNVWYADFLGLADARRAALLAAAAPVPGLPPAADHGVQRQGRALGRHARSPATPVRCSGASPAPTASTRSTS